MRYFLPDLNAGQGAACALEPVDALLHARSEFATRCKTGRCLLDRFRLSGHEQAGMSA